MLPREHGAYGQIAFPLIAAYAVAGVSTTSLLMTVTVIAGFLAHEPAAIVLGQRGGRVKRELGASATRWLVCCLAVGVAAGLAAVSRLDAVTRWSLAIPTVPAVALMVAMIKGREKSWFGEAAAALAFAGAAVPIALAAGVSMDMALAVAIPFALLFTTTTLAVRVVVLRVRGGGDPGAAAATQRAALILSGVSALMIGVLAMTGWLASSVLIAAAPGLLTGAIVAVRPPAATRLRSLGWSLVAVSTLTTLIVIATA